MRKHSHSSLTTHLRPLLRSERVASRRTRDPRSSPLPPHTGSSLLTLAPSHGILALHPSPLTRDPRSSPFPPSPRLLSFCPRFLRRPLLCHTIHPRRLWNPCHPPTPPTKSCGGHCLSSTPCTHDERARARAHTHTHTHTHTHKQAAASAALERWTAIRCAAE